MPQLVEDAKQVTKWIEEKQALEFTLGLELVDAFNTPDLLNPLRRAAGRALEEMILAAANEPLALEALKGAVGKEKSVEKLLTREVLSGPKPPPGTKQAAPCGKTITDVSPADPVPGLGKLYKDVGTFDCQECSDAIRLYGEFVEFLKDKAGDIGSKYMEYFIAKESEKDKGTKSKTESAIWNELNKKDGKPLGNFELGRWRKMAAGQYDSLFQDNPKKYALKPGEKEAVFLDTHNVKQFLGMLKGGSAIWDLQDGSTINKIDQLFGLVASSDISGTTTDTIFFLKKFLGENIMGVFDHIFYLLPLATIVAGSHHSILEVAAPLSMSKPLDPKTKALGPKSIINYRIGYYDTLMPTKRTTHPGVAAVDKKLKAAMADERNRHMLVFYSDKEKPAGCYQFTGKEASWLAFVDSVKVLGNPIFKKLPPWPKKMDVFNQVVMGCKLQ